LHAGVLQVPPLPIIHKNGVWLLAFSKWLKNKLPNPVDLWQKLDYDIYHYDGMLLFHPNNDNSLQTTDYREYIFINGPTNGERIVAINKIPFFKTALICALREP